MKSEYVAGHEQAEKTERDVGDDLHVDRAVIRHAESFHGRDVGRDPERIEVVVGVHELHEPGQRGVVPVGDGHVNPTLEPPFHRSVALPWNLLGRVFVGIGHGGGVFVRHRSLWTVGVRDRTIGVGGAAGKVAPRLISVKHATRRSYDGARKP
jgi:hypothetical protein